MYIDKKEELQAIITMCEMVGSLTSQHQIGGHMVSVRALIPAGTNVKALSENMAALRERSIIELSRYARS